MCMYDYEQLLEAGSIWILIKRMGEEWIDHAFTAWMSHRFLSVIIVKGYEVIKKIFGLSDDESKSIYEIVVIMNMSKKAVVRINHWNLRKMRHHSYELSFYKNVTV